MDPRDQAAMIQQLMQSPYYTEGAYGADQAAAAKMRRPDEPGIAYGSRPDVRQARDEALANIGVGAIGAGMTAPVGAAYGALGAMGTDASGALLESMGARGVGRALQGFGERALGPMTAGGAAVGGIPGALIGADMSDATNQFLRNNPNATRQDIRRWHEAQRFAGAGRPTDPWQIPTE